MDICMRRREQEEENKEGHEEKKSVFPAHVAKREKELLLIQSSVQQLSLLTLGYICFNIQFPGAICLLYRVVVGLEDAAERGRVIFRGHWPPHSHLSLCTVTVPIYYFASSSGLLLTGSFSRESFGPMLSTQKKDFFFWKGQRPQKASLQTSMSPPQSAVCPSHILLQNSVDPSYCMRPLLSFYTC